MYSRHLSCLTWHIVSIIITGSENDFKPRGLWGGRGVYILIFRSCHLCKNDCNKSEAGIHHYYLFRLDNWWLGGVMVLTYLHWNTKSTGWVSRRSCPWTGSWSSGSLLKQRSGDVPWIPALTEPASGLHQLNSVEKYDCKLLVAHSWPC